MFNIDLYQSNRLSMQCFRLMAFLSAIKMHDDKFLEPTKSSCWDNEAIETWFQKKTQGAYVFLKNIFIVE